MGQFRSYLGFLLILMLAACGKAPQKVDFSSQIKPIINKQCIVCHGGVKRNSNFSLLFRQDALDTAESGKLAIMPGDPDHSEMIRRLTLQDPEERMPFKEEPLKRQEIDLLRKWISEGANWGDHWAYVAPKQIVVPKSTQLFSGIFSRPRWEKNEIDHFISQKLEQQKLEPSDEADKSTLLRRVCLDLTGIPPGLERAEAFLKDERIDAYERLVEELLTSPRFGEKWASWWLDMARYSDTKGYERDVYRNIWRYRDWVIQSFNHDKPFDQFTIEQLAGDLLPNPTDEELIATAFHRNTMNNDEGGTEDEEFRVAAVIDRVNTTMEVWQSTTFGCVQCHSHPYDPFRHEEYYKFMAFFNNTRDEDTHGEHPNLRTYKEEDQQKVESIRAWVRNLSGEEKAKEVQKFLTTMEPKYHPHDFDNFVNGELIDVKWLGIRNGGSARLKNIDLSNKKYLIINHLTRDTGGSFEIRVDQLNGEKVANVKLDTTKKGRKAISIALKPTAGKHDLYFIFHNTKSKPSSPVSDIEWFAFREDFFAGNANLDKEFLELINQKVENTPIAVENGPAQHRQTNVFERGNWLVKGQEVSPEVPQSLNPFPKNAPADRLGLAQWLVAPENPLTSRTVVNRVWEQFFGNGLVETLEDFGTQGASPSHPELLDWLSIRLMSQHQWSLKKLMKDIVMSATYRQASKVSEKEFYKDPTNRWLARGPRMRLSAEQVRDQALVIGGLLSEKMYGHSIMPYQPEGVWQSVYSNARWESSKGEDQYRRAVYIFQKRTSPYPSMLTFDGSSREVCQVRRIKTNTPLQSLVTMNDPVYFDAAKSFSAWMVANGNSPDEQIRAGYRKAVFKEISPKKLEALKNLYDEALSSYHSNATLKSSLMKEGSDEVAAMTLVASAILNLDETLNIE